MFGHIVKTFPRALTLLYAFSLLSCAQAPAPEQAGWTLQQKQCARFLRGIKNAINDHQVRDAQYTPVEGYPVFRTDRFLASFSVSTMTMPQKEALNERLFLNETESLAMEIQNLPAVARQTLMEQYHTENLGDYARQCNQLLRPLYYQHFVAQNPPLQVPDSYNTFARAAGLYPVTAFLYQPGFNHYTKLMKQLYSQGRQQPFNQALVYRPIVSSPGFTSARIEKILDHAAQNNALGIPLPGPGTLAQLFRQFSPIIYQQQVSGHDEIGRLRWRKGEPPSIDGNSPVVYNFYSFTRRGNDILLQLNYNFWYPQRPDETWADFYSGNLDGILWRVTLKQDGTVLAYDSIHPCGCYHKVYLPEGRPIPKLATHDEPPLYFTTDIPTAYTGPVTIKITAARHYIIHVSTARPESGDRITYPLAPYAQLRSLPHNGGYRSLFGPDGIAPTTERMERWILWPMGIPSAGAMRQRGHHATAFYGTRHFDDPFIFDELLPEQNSGN